MGSRRRGRQTEATRNDKALLDAARVLFAVHGPDTAVATIAARADTGIASLYRRFPTKEALLQQLCLAAMAETITAADAALADEDPWRGLRTFVETCAADRTGAFVGLGASITTTAEMNRRFANSQDRLEAVVTRAQDAGHLRTDVNAIDLRLLIEMVSRRPPDDETYRRTLGIALDGLRPVGSRTSLPGTAPTLATYMARWHARP